MNTLIKKLLFNTVLIVIGLHAIILHPHTDELSKSEHVKLHSKSNTIIGFMRLIFHENNDESLDNLIFSQQGERHTLDHKSAFPTLPFLNNVTFYLKKIKQEKIIRWKINHFKGLFFGHLNGTRAPPFYSSISID